jgi:hypothetical protein
MKIKKSFLPIYLFAILFGFFIGNSAYGILLSDSQLYFDPDSIVDDFYSRKYIDDLSVLNSVTWTSGTDPIIDADILPILKPGSYSVGYFFSQSDYYQTPNVDYFADLTTGTLTSTFNMPGLYHVRISRYSGSQEIVAIFAESGLKEEEGKKDKTGAAKKLDPLPNADLFLVEVRDDTMDNSAKIWENAGKNVQRVTSRQDVVNKIKQEAQKAEYGGKKIHVEIDGHGYGGYISTGGGWKKGTDYYIDINNVLDFQKEIDDYVKYITFQGCSTGKGADGGKFLSILASSIGSAGAWDEPVTVVDKKYFAVSRNANFKVVPEPSSIFLFISGLVLFLFARKKGTMSNPPFGQA